MHLLFKRHKSGTHKVVWYKCSQDVMDLVMDKTVIPSRKEVEQELRDLGASSIFVRDVRNFKGVDIHSAEITSRVNHMMECLCLTRRFIIATVTMLNKELDDKSLKFSLKSWKTTFRKYRAALRTENLGPGWRNLMQGAAPKDAMKKNVLASSKNSVLQRMKVVAEKHTGVAMLGEYWFNFMFRGIPGSPLLRRLRRPKTFKAIPGLAAAGKDDGHSLANIEWIRDVWQPDYYITFEPGKNGESEDDDWVVESRTFLSYCKKRNEECTKDTNVIKCHSTPCQYKTIFVTDWTTPLADQMLYLWTLSGDDGENRLVMHCTAGYGRTGFMLGSLFWYHGLVSTPMQFIKKLAIDYRLPSADEVLKLWCQSRPYAATYGDKTVQKPMHKQGWEYVPRLLNALAMRICRLRDEKPEGYLRHIDRLRGVQAALLPLSKTTKTHMVTAQQRPYKVKVSPPQWWKKLKSKNASYNYDPWEDD